MKGNAGGSKRAHEELIKNDGLPCSPSINQLPALFIPAPPLSLKFLSCILESPVHANDPKDAMTDSEGERSARWKGWANAYNEQERGWRWMCTRMSEGQAEAVAVVTSCAPGNSCRSVRCCAFLSVRVRLVRPPAVALLTRPSQVVTLCCAASWRRRQRDAAGIIITSSLSPSHGSQVQVWVSTGTPAGLTVQVPRQRWTWADIQVHVRVPVDAVSSWQGGRGG